MFRRLAAPAAIAVAASLAAGAPAALAQGDGPPPPPTAANGAVVEPVASGLATPTSFAFAPDGTSFAGVGPGEGKGKAPSGVFTLAGGKATKVPGTAPVVFGMAWHNGRLFVSAGSQIVSYRGWNGTRFTGSRIVRRAGKDIVGFNGIAFGPNGRLYTGVSLDEKSDAKKGPGRYANTVLSMRATGADLKVVARGLRQPFQLVFPQGSSAPIVSDLSQETGKVPLDRLVVAKQGSNFGFPTCLVFKAGDCPKFTQPLVTFPKHASPMGVGTIGQTLYVALFGGLQKNKPSVQSMPVAGGTPTTFMSFAVPVVALGTNAGYVYTGDVTGSIWRVQAPAAG
jgi:glucose/arabinose dehydrogenase